MCCLIICYAIFPISLFIISARPLPPDRDPSAVYANNELKLSEIDVYGFDYDYTIACYNDSLNRLIYNLGRSNLVNELKVISW